MKIKAFVSPLNGILTYISFIISLRSSRSRASLCHLRSLIFNRLDCLRLFVGLFEAGTIIFLWDFLWSITFEVYAMLLLRYLSFFKRFRILWPLLNYSLVKNRKQVMRTSMPSYSSLCNLLFKNCVWYIFYQIYSLYILIESSFLEKRIIVPIIF